MPVVFIFSAMVSALPGSCCSTWPSPNAQAEDRHALRGLHRHVSLLYLIIDFSLEMLDLIHRIYEAGDHSAA